MSLAGSPRVVAHVDMDAFYVSVELQRRPELRGLPVVVAGSGPRAVVTTASYEARRYGIFSATPAERARRLCPEAVFVPPDFEHYRARSRDVHEVLRAHVERVESVGLDEAYLDLSGIERYRAAARRVKEAVRDTTGLTCSVGIGPEQAGRQGGERRREARRLRRAVRRGGARALRERPLPVSSRASARRPSSGSSGSESRLWAPSARPPTPR